MPLGLVTQKQYDKLQAEIEALKRAREKWESWQLLTAEGERYILPDPSIYGNQADLYRTLSWVLLAVDITASAGSLTPFSVARIISDKEPKDIPNHPFEQLLRFPNEMDSRKEFLYATIAFYRLTGNAYWWMNSKDKYTPPDEMWIIPPQMIKPIPDKNMYLKGYMYYPGTGAEIFMEPHEIVHFRRFNPASRFVGLSAIESIALVAAGDLGMQKYNTTLFANNNGRLPSVMTFENMVADPTWDKIKSDTREAARNREMLMLRGVGQGGVQWLQNAVSQREMEFLEGRKFNKEEILTVLAPGAFTMLSENSTQANSVVGRAAFNELTIYPMHVELAEKITQSILPRYGGRKLIGLFDDVRAVDKDMKLREQEAFERSHTLKEVREEMYGDDPIGDERDDLLISELGKAKVQNPELPKTENVTPDNVMPEQPQTEPDNEDAIKALDDLQRYRRRALRSVGKSFIFESDHISPDVLAEISRSLPTCKSESAVKDLFDRMRDNIKPRNAVLELANAINRLAG